MISKKKKKKKKVPRVGCQGYEGPRGWKSTDRTGLAGAPAVGGGGARGLCWCWGSCTGVRREVPWGTPGRGGGGVWRWRGWQRGCGEGPRCLLDECSEAVPQVLGTHRCTRAEEKKGPLPITEGAVTEVGREESALRGGPEARPKLPLLLDTRVVEEELRDL